MAGPRRTSGERGGNPSSTPARRWAGVLPGRQGSRWHRPTIAQNTPPMSGCGCVALTEPAPYRALSPLARSRSDRQGEPHEGDSGHLAATTGAPSTSKVCGSKQGNIENSTTQRRAPAATGTLAPRRRRDLRAHTRDSRSPEATGHLLDFSNTPSRGTESPGEARLRPLLTHSAHAGSGDPAWCSCRGDDQR